MKENFMKKIIIVLFMLLFSISAYSQYQGGYGDGFSDGNEPVFMPPSGQNLIFTQGWNMISSYVTPVNTSINSIFAPLSTNFLIVKDNFGNVYWPEWGINDIGTWDISNCYQIYLLTSDDLYINGAQINPSSTPINLTQGWQMISYLRNSMMDPVSALASIQGNFLIVKDNLGEVYWPDWGIQDIINLEPGQGYQIYMSQPGTLIYPGN